MSWNALSIPGAAAGEHPRSTAWVFSAQLPRDRWIVGLLVANAVHAAVFSVLYPEHRWDPDLIAYFTFFRNWVADDPALHGLAYYSGPKLLLVFTLGALGSPSAALVCTSAVSALFGVVVYLVARDSFGKPVAVTASLLLLLDPSKAFLTLKSSADLYLAAFIFLSILLCQRGRPLAASVCVLLSALIKPVTLPCALYFLVAPNGHPSRAPIAALLPMLALPLILAGNHALIGSALGGGTYFGEFATMADREPLGPGGLIHYALWSQLLNVRFLSTGTWGLLGMLLWIAGDSKRLTHPLFLMPLLFLFGYLLLSAVLPFPPYFRYFWPLEIWFLLFLVYGIFEGARRLASGDARLRRAVIALVLFILGNDLIQRQLDYQRGYAVLIERSTHFARAAIERIQRERAATDTVVAPLSLLPYMTWALADAAGIDTAERLARERLTAHADWIIDVPGMYKTATARQWIGETVRSNGYVLRMNDGQSALFRRSSADPSTVAADLPSPPPSHQVHP